MIVRASLLGDAHPKNVQANLQLVARRQRTGWSLLRGQLLDPQLPLTAADELPVDVGAVAAAEVAHLDTGAVDFQHAVMTRGRQVGPRKLERAIL